MPRNDLVSGIVLFAVGVLMLVWIIPTQTSTSGDYTISPALLPQICALGITVFSAVLMVVSAARLKRGEHEATPVASREEWTAAAAVIVTVVVAILLFRLVNPALAALFLVAALMLYMGERRWWLLILVPGGLVGTGYLLMYEVLGMAVR